MIPRSTRSEKRQTDAVLSIRLTTAEKHELTTLARLRGYPTLTAFALQHIRAGAGGAHGTGYRDRIILAGHLGRIGGYLTQIMARHTEAGPPALLGALRHVSQEIVALQHDLIRASSHACESH